MNLSAPAQPVPEPDQQHGVYVLSLEAGWNLVSIPIQPDSPGIAQIFDPSICSATVRRYDPRKSGYGPVREIEPLAAYWVHARRPVKLSISGRILQDTTRMLTPGWNLCGPGTTITIPEHPAITPQFWQWRTSHSAYTLARDRLLHGRGYWVLCLRAPCRIDLGGPSHDRDGDGIWDIWEHGCRADPEVPDTDGDGLDDGEEVFTHGTRPDRIDTDGDGLSDAWELAHRQAGFDPLVADSDHNHVPDGADDWDLDGLANTDEQHALTNPAVRDSDGDGLFDEIDPDPHVPAVLYVHPLYIAQGTQGLAVPVLAADNAPGTLLEGLALDMPLRWATAESAWRPANKLVPGSGYAVTGLEPETARLLCGFLVDHATITLKNGWNLVAMPLDTRRPQDPRIQSVLEFTDRSDPDGLSVTPPELKRNAIYWFRVDAGSVEALDVDVHDWLEDTDADRMPDAWENRTILAAEQRLNPERIEDIAVILPGDDYDHDLISNYLEYRLGTNPTNSDSDGDTLPDNFEVVHGLPAAAVDAPLVVWWPFDAPDAGNQFLNACNPAAHNGILSDPFDRCAFTPGPLHEALRLATDMHVAVGESNAFNAWHVLSLSLWVRPTQAGLILSRIRETGAPVFAVDVDEIGYLNVHIHDAPTLDTSFLVTDGAWHHVLLCLSAEHAVLYVDGDRIGAVQRPDPSLDAGHNPVVLGATEPGAANGVGGEVDDLRIFNAALKLVDALQLSQVMTDSDLDGIPDRDEFEGGTHPRDADTDGDGVEDGDEMLNGTDPTAVDTDGDGLPDGWELEYGLNPNRDDARQDPDNDGITTRREYELGLNPRYPDTGDATVTFETDRTWVMESQHKTTVKLGLNRLPPYTRRVEATVVIAPESSATPALDFTLNSPLTVSFDASRMTRLLDIEICCDDENESAETIVLLLENLRGAGRGPVTEHRLIIQNDLCINHDADGDGLPDAWEKKYFGHLGLGAHDNPDADDADNLREYKLGRHPNAGWQADIGDQLKLRVTGVIR